MNDTHPSRWMLLLLLIFWFLVIDHAYLVIHHALQP
jgi:hypothetical protein